MRYVRGNDRNEFYDRRILNVHNYDAKTVVAGFEQLLKRGSREKQLSQSTWNSQLKLHTAAVTTSRINLSPFTKDCRMVAAFNATITHFLGHFGANDAEV